MAGMYPTNREITSFGKTVRFPGVDANGRFTNGDFSNPDVPPSFLDADTINLIIDNLNSLVAHLGNSANNTDTEQLKKLFTVAAEANKAIKRDASGRAKVEAPSASDDIARKAEVDAEAKARSDGDVTVTTKLSNHTQSKQNPHGVTKAQVGLGSCDNTADKDKTVKSAGTCTGNSATATKWQTARNINGLSVQGDADRSSYTTCSTAAGTQAKTCTCAGFALVTGAEITIKFTVTNTANAPTLNVNNTGAKSIYYRGAAIAAGYLAANRTYTFRYNGTQYELVGDINTDTNTTYSAATQSAAGLMSAADKKKLDGIAASANAYSHPTGAGNNHIPSGGSSGQILRWKSAGVAEWGADNNTTYPAATQSAAGLMSAADKLRLDKNYVTASSFGTSSGYIKYSNGLIMQWVKEFSSNDADNKISLPIAMTSVNYVILDGRKGTNLADVSGWKEKQKEYFVMNPENAHITDYFIIGY